MPGGGRYIVPDRRHRLFDYRQECARCGWSGWLRSELTLEPQTNLLVCPPCLDKPRAYREPREVGTEVRNVD